MGQRSEPLLRAMRESDLPEVVEIERLSFSVPWSEATFRGLMRRPSASLITADLLGRVVGYFVLWSVVNEAELGDLAVHPAHRCRGLGRRLLESALREARGRKALAMSLEVRAGNAEARRLYEGRGFEVIRVRRNHYSSPPEDALVMRLQLAPATR